MTKKDVLSKKKFGWKKGDIKVLQKGTTEKTAKNGPKMDEKPSDNAKR
jgi:hypothetical protein